MLIGTYIFFAISAINSIKKWQEMSACRRNRKTAYKKTRYSQSQAPYPPYHLINKRPSYSGQEKN